MNRSISCNLLFSVCLFVTTSRSIVLAGIGSTGQGGTGRELGHGEGMISVPGISTDPHSRASWPLEQQRGTAVTACGGPARRDRLLLRPRDGPVAGRGPAVSISVQRLRQRSIFQRPQHGGWLRRSANIRSFSSSMGRLR